MHEHKYTCCGILYAKINFAAGKNDGMCKQLLVRDKQPRGWKLTKHGKFTVPQAFKFSF